MATDEPSSHTPAADPPETDRTDPRLESRTVPEPPHPEFAEYAGESVPAAAVGSPGKQGHLELHFGTDGDGETNLVRDHARTPFHLSGTLGHDRLSRAETVYVQSPTGGVAQGDRRTVDIVVGPDAVGHVSTQSSTKVLSMSHNYAATDISLSVDAGGHLDYVPEPTILNADARFHQRTALSVAASGSAVVGNVVVPGRLARGERFEFERYRDRFQVHSDGALLVDDGTSLAPGEADPTAPGLLDDCAVFGTLYVVAPDEDCDPLSDRLHDAVQAEDERSADAAERTVRAGATRLPNDTGVVVRAVGHRAESVTATLRNGWDAARTALLGVGAPDSRRL